MGRFFAVETKAPGKTPTRLQEILMGTIIQCGGKVFVIDGDLSALEEWLK